MRSDFVVMEKFRPSRSAMRSRSARVTPNSRSAGWYGSVAVQWRWILRRYPCWPNPIPSAARHFPLRNLALEFSAVQLHVFMRIARIAIQAPEFAAPIGIHRPANGMSGESQRFKIERTGRTKYSVPHFCRARGEEAARRAMPTSPSAGFTSRLLAGMGEEAPHGACFVPPKAAAEKRVSGAGFVRRG